MIDQVFLLSEHLVQAADLLAFLHLLPAVVHLEPDLYYKKATKVLIAAVAYCPAEVYCCRKAAHYSELAYLLAGVCYYKAVIRCLAVCYYRAAVHHVVVVCYKAAVRCLAVCYY